MSGDQKIKTAAGKIPLNLIPLRVLKGVARVFGYGAVKYKKGNWFTATDDDFGDRYAGGALRHLSDAQNMDGTFDFSSMASLDKESGLPEFDHMLCGLIMLRGLLIKRGILPEDPGVGNDPPNTLARALDVEIANPSPPTPALRALFGDTACDAPADACDCRDCNRSNTLGPLTPTRPTSDVPIVQGSPRLAALEIPWNIPLSIRYEVK